MSRLRFFVLLALVAAVLAAPAVARADDQPATPPVATTNGFSDGNGGATTGLPPDASPRGMSDGNGRAQGDDPPPADDAAQPADPPVDPPPSFGMSDGNG